MLEPVAGVDTGENDRSTTIEPFRGMGVVPSDNHSGAAYGHWIGSALEPSCDGLFGAEDARMLDRKASMLYKSGCQ
ncbi:hypothetical protein [Roseiflexus sp.]|uniref:hypothetical protein n=1 Tax=Roseiflexus sp. TaxID=2562120 RepID=UPI00398A6D27